jgi:hypothetical protein
VAHACNPSYSGDRTEIRRIMVQSQPRQIDFEILSRKKSITKKIGESAGGVAPPLEFKTQHQKKKRERERETGKICTTARILHMSLTAK